MRILTTFLPALFLLSSASANAEEWIVYKDGSDVWALEKSSINRNAQSGLVTIRLGRYHNNPQTEGIENWSYDIRRYLVDCAQNKTKNFQGEKFTANGRPLPFKPGDVNAPWVPATFGWPLKVKSLACESASPAGTKASSKISAMAMMPSLAGSAQKPKSTTAAAAPNVDALCATVKKVLGEGQRESPLFKSFYASEAERQKYAGKGSTPILGFGSCYVQQTARPPGRLSPVFASYYCEKPGGTEVENAKFAKDVSKQMTACLPTGTYVEGNDMGDAIKTYEHAVTMSGFPRVRIRHTKSGVSIHLDTKGL